MENNVSVDIEQLLAEERRRAVVRRLLEGSREAYRRHRQRSRIVIVSAVIVVALLTAFNMGVSIHQHGSPSVSCAGDAALALDDARLIMEAIKTNGQ